MHTNIGTHINVNTIIRNIRKIGTITIKINGIKPKRKLIAVNPESPK